MHITHIHATYFFRGWGGVVISSLLKCLLHDSRCYHCYQPFTLFPCCWCLLQQKMHSKTIAEMNPDTLLHRVVNNGSVMSGPVLLCHILFCCMETPSNKQWHFTWPGASVTPQFSFCGIPTFPLGLSEKCTVTKATTSFYVELYSIDK